uniref:Protein sleepless n=1 Tax=Panagrellus redivivus TaxID=6233 RepID=A0A7E4V760_PANRE
MAVIKFRLARVVKKDIIIVAVKILLPRRLPGGIVATCDQLRPGCSTSSCDDAEPVAGGSVFTVSRPRSRSIEMASETSLSPSPCRSSDCAMIDEHVNQNQMRRPSRARRKRQKELPSILQQLKCLQNGRSLRLYALLAVLVIVMVSNVPTGTASGIGCFVCSSFNGSNPECEDTFNSSVAEGATGNIANYQFPCWAFKKNRQGLFPADHCIKISGHRKDDPDHTIVIRTCAMDSGTLTADTEIVRISHCGFFKYEGHQFSGCVQACDTDGCNSAPSLFVAGLLPLWVISVGIAVLTASL